MSDITSFFEEDDDDDELGLTVRFDEAKSLLETRCKAANISLKELTYEGEQSAVEIQLKNGRHTRPISLGSAQAIDRLLSFQFENYVFLGDFEAICNYSEGVIEAGIRPSGTNMIFSSRTLFRRIVTEDKGEAESSNERIVVSSGQASLPRIEISRLSVPFATLTRSPNVSRLSLKLSGCQIKTHDGALHLLQQIAGSVLFQIDLLANLPFVMERRRVRPARKNMAKSYPLELEYPHTQYETAPLSLYNYGRSATGMPLLQFLAFYQVLEFFFPRYSQSEAHRKLKSMLKDPAFRSHNDSDITRLLTAIQTNRNGAFGDERSQLKATLNECVDADALRNFLQVDTERAEYFQGKPKALHHKIPISSPQVDLRNDVAERVYQIRCKIVHTKNDSRDASLELLLPFTQESEQLLFDIELVQFLAQQILIMDGAPLNLHL
ncbi:MAG: hypothetical protein AB1437_03875 [Pseudomonadota bacterium]